MEENKVDVERFLELFSGIKSFFTRPLTDWAGALNHIFIAGLKGKLDRSRGNSPLATLPFVRKH